MRHQHAFTLIELVLVILLIGVLAVVALPKLLTQSDVSAYTLRDQLLGQLRLVQMQALHQRGVCHNIHITPNTIGIARNDSMTCSAISRATHTIDASDVQVTIGSNTTLDIRFDSQGRPTLIDGTGDCIGGCVITLVGTDTTSITIESEGYIHGS